MIVLLYFLKKGGVSLKLKEICPRLVQKGHAVYIVDSEGKSLLFRHRATGEGDIFPHSRYVAVISRKWNKVIVIDGKTEVMLGEITLSLAPSSFKGLNLFVEEKAARAVLVADIKELAISNFPIGEVVPVLQRV